MSRHLLFENELESMRAVGCVYLCVSVYECMYLGEQYLYQLLDTNMQKASALPQGH